MIFIILFVVAITFVIFCLIYFLRYYHGTIEKYYNPRIISTLKADKLRVLVYQCGAYNIEPEFLKLSRTINRMYCDKYEYDYHYINYPIEKYPPFWIKAIALQELMVNNSHKYDYIVYIDCDAVFYDFNISIESLLCHVDKSRKYSMILGKDPTPITLINAGAFIVQCTPKSKEIIEEWSSMCFKNGKFVDRGTSWTYKDKKWSCSSWIYGGRYYEQGALGEIFKRHKSNMAILNTYFLSNTSVSTKSYVLHLMGNNDKNRYQIFKKYLDHITLIKP
jgi:hypothetical protein